MLSRSKYVAPGQKSIATTGLRSSLNLCLVNFDSAVRWRDSQLDNMYDDAESRTDTRISRRWIAALILVLGLNISLVAWSMSVPVVPAPAAVITAPPQSAGEALLPGEPPRKSACNRSAPPIETRIDASPDHSPAPTHLPREVARPVENAPNSPIALPVEPSEPTGAESQPILTIVNPRRTGGPVYYAVDGEVFCLQAGQYHQLPGHQPRTIEFDRGDDYGYAEQRASEGTYAFEVGSSGWTLTLTERRPVLLEGCQPIAPRP
jgi:hypothetical protein